MKVLVVDISGQPRSGALVTWTVQAGGGTISPIRDVTDSHGMAMAVWTLGPLAGPNEVTAQASDDLAVTLNTVAEAFRVDRVAGSTRMGCGLVAGELWCWGSDSWVSSEATSLRPNPPFGWTGADAPGLVPGATGLTDIAVSASHSVCVLDSTGGVLCASGDTPALAQRADLPPLRRLAGSSEGWGEYCGLAAADSTAWCWEQANAAVAVPGSPAFVDLDIDGGHPHYFLACGILVDSSAACWGSGSLGDGSGASSTSPVAVSGGHRFAEVAVGTMFACGRQSDGAVWCWGRNTSGELGTPGPNALTPVLATTGATRISASQNVVLALKGGTTLLRWGGHLTPGPVASLAGLAVADLEAKSIECLMLGDRQVYCVDELWDISSNWRIDTYAPVHPVVAGAP